TVTGGPAKVAFTASPVVWFQDGGTLGVTVNGRHYGIFGPTGSAWTGSGQARVSTLAGKNYLSVAVLPDGLTDDAARKTALALFRAHAHAHVVSTRAAWTYDEKAARVTTTLTTTTVAREGTETRTLQALYRHQWLNSPTSLTAYTYASPRGTMKLATAGNSLTTIMPFRGILPSFPDKGFDHAVLQGYLNAENDYEVADGETYATGKKLARLAMLIPLADQLGNVPQRTALLGKLKAKLEAWFTASQGETGGLLYYNSKWNLLTGYPADFYSDTEVNDHHFHWSYFLMAAAVVARYDEEWARTQNWGGMVELLIKDAANWDDSDARFPRLRNFDPYAGHSWAHGSEYYGRGNNQESSSEAMNFHTALFLWGLHTGNRTIRDLGAWMYANEAEATLQYWFDVDNAVFPDFFPNPNVGQVLSAGASYWTFFGETATFVHGINFLPLTTGSVYLARYPENLKTNIDWMYNRPDRFKAKPGLWDDVVWGALAFADPQDALKRFGSFDSYAAFDGESKAHIYHMVQNLGAMGRVQPGVLADAPSYAVFDKGGTRTYVVYNPDPTPRNVVFTDGATFEVAPRAMGSHTGPANPLGLARGGERLRGGPAGDRLLSGLEAIRTAARAWPSFSLHALDGKMVWSTTSGVLPPDHIARGRLLLFRALPRP
ncbi:MAG TPA: glycosyl hydrolase, partial [Fibrobacteria bacterium]|nr:glycosyl hydrolase [Fibrobacteria bacterium]